MNLADKPVHLVGSVAGENAEEVLRMTGLLLGDQVLGLTDGETGLRRLWVHFVLVTTLLPHPDLEPVRKPKGIAGMPDWVPANYDDLYQVRPRAGAGALRFETLKCPEIAAESYRVFRRLRDTGVIARTTRFQQCLPFPEDVCRLFTSNADDMHVLVEAYLDAMKRDVRRLLETIPADDLVLQWDVNWEVLAVGHDDYVAGGAPLHWRAHGDPLARYGRYVRELTGGIPPAVRVGVHLCYGDLNHRHFIEPDDLALCVRMANLAVTQARCPVAFVHMPVPRSRDDDAYFGALADPDLAGGTLYAGLVHYTDGVPGALRRAATLARPYDGPMGFATECGIGRRPPGPGPADPPAAAPRARRHARRRDARMNRVRRPARHAR